MKRRPELIPLSKEHHESLVLAKKCQRTAAAGKRGDIALLCQQIVRTFSGKWEQHFRSEETGIFSLAEACGGEMAILCGQLRQEHDRLREIHRAMKGGDCSGLNAFGELLQTHTRKEERELFPLLEASFSDEQLRLATAKHRPQRPASPSGK